MNPLAVDIPRKDVRYDRHHTPAISGRFPVIVESETAPRPVDYTSFHGVGRDVSHAMPHRWHYYHLAIQDKLSIAAWPFGIRKVIGAMVIPASRNTATVGGANPVQERTNIVSPKAEALSRRASVYAMPVYAPQYAKIV